MELLRNSKDKKARKLTKKRVSLVFSPAWISACNCLPRNPPLPACNAPLTPQLGTLLRSKRKLEELSNVIQEQRRQTGH